MKKGKILALQCDAEHGIHYVLAFNQASKEPLFQTKWSHIVWMIIKRILLFRFIRHYTYKRWAHSFTHSPAASQTDWRVSFFSSLLCNWNQSVQWHVKKNSGDMLTRIILLITTNHHHSFTKQYSRMSVNSSRLFIPMFVPILNHISCMNLWSLSLQKLNRIMSKTGCKNVFMKWSQVK